VSAAKNMQISSYTRRAVSAVIMIISAAILAGGCDRLPGKPGPADLPLRPSNVLDFATLYSENCAGCHGPNGSFGAALPLNNPVYLAMVDDSTLIRVIANGIDGTAMPPFALQSGGQLTNQQVAIIIAGMRSHWQNGAVPAAGQPPYTATGGDPARGAQVYVAACQSCHGPDGKGSDKAGSIVDPSFLSLVSAQELRSIVIAGRPDLGHPDWRGYVAGKPLDAGQITDLIAWIIAQKPTIGLTAPSAP